MTSSDNHPSADEFSLNDLELTPEWAKGPGKDFSAPGSDRPPREERRSRSGPKPGGRPPRPGGGPGGARGPQDRPSQGQRRPQRDQPSHRPVADRPAPAPIEALFVPEELGFEAMIERIKQTHHAYALFDLARLVLSKPQRYLAKLTRKPGPDGQRPPFYFVALSENPFLNHADAVRFVLRRHLPQIAREVNTPVDPPKGNFTFVNRCGLTGVWLGAPNHHEYQSNLVRHHQRRLRHLPFDEFKERIQTVRDEQAVKAWIAAMSVKTEHECALCAAPAPAPVEPVAVAGVEPAPPDAAPPAPVLERFATPQELEQHFVARHAAEVITELPEVMVSGAALPDLEQRNIVAAIRDAWETERRFPIVTVNALRPRLQRAGFHFFKHPDGVVYLTRHRLKRFEAGQTLTDEIQRILTLVRQKGGCKSKQLIAQLLPANAAATAAAPAPEPAATEEAKPVSSAEEPILANLRWLLTEGYVVELSDGRLWAPTEKVSPPPTPPPAPPAPAEPVAPAPTSPEPA